MSWADPETESAETSADGDPLLVLLPRALAGDTLAMRALLGALSPEVARVARAVVGGQAAELDDVVQETLLGLLHALPSFRGECGLRRFANRIAVRTALRARKRSRERLLQQQALGEQSAQLAPGASRTPDALCLAARRKELLRRLLDELPEAQAETLALRVVAGLSLEETAAATAVPINTVRSRVRLAREALRARIEAEPELRELLEDVP